MKIFNRKSFKISNVNKYRLRAIFYVAVFWTLTDFFTVLARDENTYNAPKSLWVRESVIFFVSIIMAYIFIYKLKRIFRGHAMWLNFILKSLILLGAAFVINFIIHYFNHIIIYGETSRVAVNYIFHYALHKDWLVQKVLYWIIIFFITQLFLIINEKYSPGVFLDILLGRYVEPKIEKRIVMFMDLKDSTPIAERLGHQLYFNFIRDFIYQASIAIIEFEGTIYQYVGDEIVTSWLFEKNNTRKCLEAVIECRKNIQRRGGYFRRKYGFVPEFRVGIHLGDVTVGEIGVIKKDLAMSGDTVNTTARIRTASNELNHRFIVSKDFIENIDLKKWQSTSLGIVDLKGKENGIELFSLEI
jgi:adenylate cyclase